MIFQFAPLHQQDVAIGHLYAMTKLMAQVAVNATQVTLSVCKCRLKFGFLPSNDIQYGHFQDHFGLVLLSGLKASAQQW